MSDTNIRSLIEKANNGRLAEEDIEHLQETVKATSDRTTVRQVGQFIRNLLTSGSHFLSSYKKMPITITGCSTTEQAFPLLQGELFRLGLIGELGGGEYATYLHDLMTIKEADQGYLILLLDIRNVLLQLTPGSSICDFINATDKYFNTLFDAVTEFRRNNKQKIILNTLQLPREFYLQVLSLDSRNELSVYWRSFNRRLLQLESHFNNLWVIDLDLNAAQCGVVDSNELSIHAKIEISGNILAEYMRDATRVIAANEGMSQKIIISDIDGTLWPGILAESSSPAGFNDTVLDSFVLFEKGLKNLSKQGVLLGVCSKNDKSDVSDYFSAHDKSQLEESDFAVVDVGWNPKPQRIISISNKLNIGLDAFVFIDDNPSEIGSVSRLVPEVMCVEVDSEDAADNLIKLLDNAFLNRLSVSDEDLIRTRQYRDNIQREKIKQVSLSYEDYLESLGTKITLREMGEKEILRVAELTQRTNQWNFTTIRMNEDDIRTYRLPQANSIQILECSDQYGDYGLIGAVFSRSDQSENTLFVDNFVMSCRVMGRGVEDWTLQKLISQLNTGNQENIYIHFRETKKNAKDLDFLQRIGARKISETQSSVYRNGISPSCASEVFILSKKNFSPSEYCKYIKDEL